MDKKLNVGYFRSQLIAFMLIAAGLALRLLTITKRNLWFDELLTNNFSYQSICIKSKLFGLSAFSYYLYRIKIDSISFIYTIAIYIYSYFFGNWESLRYLSAVFSFISVILFYKLSGLLLDRNERIYALAIMVFSPFQIWYAQEARGYALQSFFSLVSIYFYCKAAQNNRPLNWICFSLSGIMGLYSSYYFLFLIAGTGLFLLAKENRRLATGWLWSVLAMTIAAIPSLSIFIKQFDFIRDKFWVPHPNLSSIPFSLGVLSLGYSAGHLPLTAGIVLCSALFIHGAISYYKESKNDALLMLLLSLLPVILIFAVSNIVAPIYLDRKLIIFAPFFYIIMAKSLSRIRNIALKASVIISGLFLAGSSLFGYYANHPMITRSDGKDFYEGVHFKKDYSGPMSFMLKHYRNGDIVCCTDTQSCIISCAYFERYNKELLSENYNFIFYPELLAPFEAKYMRTAAARNNAIMLEKDGPFIRQANDGRGNIVDYSGLDKAGRIWLVSSLWETSGELSLNSKKVEGFLSGKYRKVLSMSREGIFLTLFEVDKKP